jgi:tetratricopeptide (TPR) repeat protein
MKEPVVKFRTIPTIVFTTMLSLCVAEGIVAAETVEPALLKSHYGNGEPMWVGTVERRHLTQSPFDAWYDSGYKSYSTAENALADLTSSLDSVELEVYFGTWCSDSTRDVPRLNRILDDAAFPLDHLEMIALSDHPGEFKFSPGGKEKSRLIHRTPTIVVLRDGQEIGRIVQNSIGTLEEDLLRITTGKSYTPRFGAEAKLHGLIDADGMGALEGHESELVDELGSLGDSDSLWHYAQFDLLVNGRPEEAEIVLDVFLSLYPESARGHRLLAQAHRDLGDFERALEDVRRSLAFDSFDARALSLEQELLQKKASPNH